MANESTRTALKTLRTRCRGKELSTTDGEMTLRFETRYADYAADFEALVADAGGVVYGRTRVLRATGSSKQRWHQVEFTISYQADCYLQGQASLADAMKAAA